jgi:hypothetical protein
MTMAQPIYKMFYLRLTEAWFQLPKEEQDQLFGKVGDALKKVGGKRVIMCDSGWASEKWWAWGVEEFPSLEAMQEHVKLLTELNWMRYCESETLLGTAQQA